MKNCPRCDGSKVESFSKDALNYKWSVKLLKLEKKLKTGYLYKCAICNSYWYSQIKDCFVFVKATSLKYLDKWNEKNYLLNNEFIDVLGDLIVIKKNYKGEKNILDTPCSCTFKDGTTHNKCVISISNFPPINHFDYKDIRFIDEVEKITPSKYSINKEIRSMAYDAPEIRMSFFPTFVKAKNKERFVLNEYTLFFDYKGVIGEDLQLDNKNVGFNNLPESYTDKYEDYILVHCDLSKNIKSRLLHEDKNEY